MAGPGPQPDRVYKADYSGVPVFEQVFSNGNIVMRRQKDDWINATHILKVADLDKPARTRVLEKEIQSGTHEKIQGGYGRFQGEASNCPHTGREYGRLLSTKQAHGSRFTKVVRLQANSALSTSLVLSSTSFPAPQARPKSRRLAEAPARTSPAIRSPRQLQVSAY